MFDHGEAGVELLLQIFESIANNADVAELQQTFQAYGIVAALLPPGRQKSMFDTCQTHACDAGLGAC